MQRLALVLLVVATVAALITLLITRHVLSDGSGTNFATLLALAGLVGPGLFVVRYPRVRWFALWACTSLATSVLYLGFGDPYDYERELPGWPRLEIAVWIAMSICTIGPMLAAMHFGARRRTPAELATPLARRLRQVVLLCAGLGVVCAIFGLFPGERVFAGNTFLHERRAGGGYVVAFLALWLAPGLLVYRDPRKRWAWLWTAWSVPSALLVLAVVLGLHIFTRGEAMWPLVVVRSGVLCIIGLLLLAVPVIALASSNVTLPPARIAK